MSAASESVTTMEPIHGVGAVVFRLQPNQAIEILLIRKRKGFWSLPKGKLKPNESPLAAIMREVYEETKVTAEVIDLIGNVDYQIKVDRKRQRKIVDYYLLRAINDRARPTGGSEQIVAVEWVSLAEAMKRLQRPRLRALVRVVQSWFSG